MRAAHYYKEKELMKMFQFDFSFCWHLLSAVWHGIFNVGRQEGKKGKKEIIVKNKINKKNKERK